MLPNNYYGRASRDEFFTLSRSRRRESGQVAHHCEFTVVQSIDRHTLLWVLRQHFFDILCTLSLTLHFSYQ